MQPGPCYLFHLHLWLAIFHAHHEFKVNMELLASATTVDPS
jgi:hypothetical protein